MELTVTLGLKVRKDANKPCCIEPLMKITKLLRCFLIRSGCSLDATRRPGPMGAGGEEAHDMATPLHLCCQWGLEQTANELLDHGANINAQVSLTFSFLWNILN